MTKQYATIDQATIGSHQIIQQGGQVVSCDINSFPLSSNWRATQQLSAGQWSWEGGAYGTADLLSSNCVFGIVLAATANTDWPGHASGTVGYKPGSGEVVVNGSVVATVAKTAKQIMLRFELDLTSATNTFAIYSNNLLLYTVSLTSGQTWIPAGAVACTVAFDLSQYVNFGSVKFSTTPSANFKPGVFTNPTSQDPYFLATEGYIFPASASPPNQSCEARITRAVAEAFFVERGITYWTDGTSGSSWSASDLDLDNRDFALTALLTNPPRGASIVISIVDGEDPAAIPHVVATTLIDTITEPSPGVLRIKQASQIKQHDVPGQRRILPPWVATGAANLPAPISLGACREVDGLLIDELTNSYMLHDTKVTSVQIARDSGDPLDPTATPPDWTPLIDGTGIQTHTTPVGTLTCDVSSRGDIVPTILTDLLAGVGLMGSATSGVPTGWTAVPLQSHGTPSWVSTGGGRMRVTYNTWTGSGYESQANVMSTPIPAATIVSGKRYRISVDIIAADPAMPVARPAYFGFFVNDATGPTGLAGPNATLAGSFADPAWGPGSFTIDFTAPFDVRYLVALATMDHPVTDPTPGSYWMEYGNITILQLPDPPDPTAPLDGISLTDYQKAIIQTRGEQPASSWSSADTAAIDALYPYSFGSHFSQQTTREAMIRAPLDSFGAAITEDESGTLRFPLLVDPDLVADSDLAYTFERFQIEALPLGANDPATGLTLNGLARPNWYKFTDASQFVADFSPITGIDAATRAQFMRDGQYPIVSSANLHGYYDFARGAGPLLMLFDGPANAQTRFDQVCGYYTKARINWSFSASYDDVVPPSILPGKAVNVIWQTLDGEAAHPVFAAGKKVLVKRVRHFPFKRRFEFLPTWG